MIDPVFLRIRVKASNKYPNVILILNRTYQRQLTTCSSKKNIKANSISLSNEALIFSISTMPRTNLLLILAILMTFTSLVILISFWSLPIRASLAILLKELDPPVESLYVAIIMRSKGITAMRSTKNQPLPIYFPARIYLFNLIEILPCDHQLYYSQNLNMTRKIPILCLWRTSSSLSNRLLSYCCYLSLEQKP